MLVMSARAFVGLLLALCASAHLSLAWAEPARPSATVADALVSYANASDERLTELAAQWDGLTPNERRALLSEMKMRMARKRGAARGVLHIRLTRRYGAVPQKPKAKPEVWVRAVAQKNQASQNTPGFGVGFEWRVKRHELDEVDGKPEDSAVKAASSD